MVRYLPCDLPMASAQVRHQATSPTSSHANRADQFFPELHGSEFFAELYWSDGIDASVSRPSNDPGHANRCEPNQNADALQSCSCRTVKLQRALSPPT